MITFWKALEISLKSVLEGERPKSEPFERYFTLKFWLQGLSNDQVHRQHLIKHLACQMSKLISLNSNPILEKCFVHFEDDHVSLWLGLESSHLAKNQKSYGLRKLIIHTEYHACPCMQGCAPDPAGISQFWPNFQVAYLTHFLIILDDSKLVWKLITFSSIGSRKKLKRTCQILKA